MKLNLLLQVKTLLLASLILPGLSAWSQELKVVEQLDYKVGRPVARPTRSGDFVRPFLLRDSLNSYSWKVQQKSGPDGTLSNGSALNVSQFARILSNVQFGNVKASGLILSETPPTGNFARGDRLLGYNESDPANSKGFQSFPFSSLGGLRSVASAAVHHTDPGKVGDIFVNKTLNNLDLWVPLSNGTVQAIRIENIITNFSLPIAFPAPPTLSAGVIEGGTVNFTWSQSGIVTGFDIFYSVGNNTQYVLLVSAMPGARNFSSPIPLVNRDKRVFFRMRAIRGNTVSSLSNEVSVLVPGECTRGPRQFNNGVAVNYYGTNGNYRSNFTWDGENKPYLVRITNAGVLTQPVESSGDQIALNCLVLPGTNNITVTDSLGCAISTQVIIGAPTVGQYWYITQTAVSSTQIDLRAKWVHPNASVDNVIWHTKINGIEQPTKPDNIGLAPNGFRNFTSPRNPANAYEFWVSGPYNASTHSSEHITVAATGTTPPPALGSLALSVVQVFEDSIRLRVTLTGNMAVTGAKIRKWSNTNPPGPDTTYFSVNTGIWLDYNVPFLTGIVGAPLVPGGSVSWNDTGFRRPATYTYRIEAIQDGVWIFSNEIRHTPSIHGNGEDDYAPVIYQSPTGYGETYDPTQVYGVQEFDPDGIPFIYEGINSGYHKSGLEIYRNGFTQQWVGASLYKRRTWSSNSGNYYNQTGYFPGCSSCDYNPFLVTPDAVRNILLPSTPDVRHFIHDNEPVQSLEPAENGGRNYRSRPGWEQAWLYANVTFLKIFRDRGQRTTIYGMTHEGESAANFSAYPPWQDGFGTNWRYWQAIKGGFNQMSAGWKRTDNYGIKPRDAISHPRVGDLQVLYPTGIFIQRSGNAPGAPWHSAGLTEAIVPASPSTSSATIPTRFRVIELQNGLCGPGSRTFRHVLEDELGRIVNNWQAGGWIPSTMQVETDAGMTTEPIIPAPRVVLAYVSLPNYLSRSVKQSFVSGSGVLDVCIVSDNSSGQTPLLDGSLDMSKDCNDALMALWAQTEINRNHEPDMTPMVGVSPAAHLTNDQGFTLNNLYPEFYLQAVILHGLAMGTGMTFWSHSAYPFLKGMLSGAQFDQILAARKRVRREFVDQPALTKYPNFALVDNGVDIWTKLGEFVPTNYTANGPVSVDNPGGDANRYDAVWLYRKSTGNLSNDIVNKSLAYTVPVPWVSVAQINGKLWIVATMLGPVAPNASTTVTIKVKPVGDLTNIKTFTFNLVGNRTYSVERSIVPKAAEPPAPPVVGARKIRLMLNSQDNNVADVERAKARKFDEISFWLLWSELESSPGVYRFNEVIGPLLTRCEQLGIKAQFHIFLWLKRRGPGASAGDRDYTEWFPTSEVMQYSNGQVAGFNGVADYYDRVVPSISGISSMNRVEALATALGQYLAPFVARGTITGIFPVTGQNGEMGYPESNPGDITNNTGPTKWTDWSPATRTEFRNVWAPARYGSIAAANTAWSTSFTSFGSVELPGGMDNISGLFRTDFHRFRMMKLRQLSKRFHDAVNTHTTIRRGIILADTKGTQANMSGVANIAYLGAAGNLEIIYSSAGGPNWEKYFVPELIAGTLGNTIERHIEFDNDDMSTTLMPDNMDLFSNFFNLGIRAIESGADVIHLQRLGGFNESSWIQLQPYIDQLVAYIANNPLVRTRNPVATQNYYWSSTNNGGGGWDADVRIPYQNAKGSSNVQYNVRMIDDSNTDFIP